MFWDFSGSEEASAFAFSPGLWAASPRAENVGSLREVLGQLVSLLLV